MAAEAAVGAFAGDLLAIALTTAVAMVGRNRSAVVTTSVVVASCSSGLAAVINSTALTGTSGAATLLMALVVGEISAGPAQVETRLATAKIAKAIVRVLTLISGYEKVSLPPM